MVQNLIASRIASRRAFVLARLHDGGVQIQIVRHHRRAQYADGDVEHARVPNDLDGRNEKAAARCPTVRAAKKQISRVKQTAIVPIRLITMASIKRKPLLLQEQNQQHVERGEADAPNQRNAKEQIQRDGRPNHFRQIAGCDRNLRENPEPIETGRE